MSETLTERIARAMCEASEEHEGWASADPVERDSWVALSVAAIKEMGRSCEIPPDGWSCSRQPGHTGPCAARTT